MYTLQPFVAAEQLADRQTAAAASRAVHQATHEHHPTPGTAASRERILLRRAVPQDGRTLKRLARLDSAHVPEGELLVAEVDGRIAAAVALDGGRAIADPFRPTAELVELLRMRAKLLDGGGARVARLRARLPRLGAAA